MAAGQHRSSTEKGSRSPATNAELSMGNQVSAGLNEVCPMKKESLSSRNGPSAWKGNTLGTEDQEPLDLGSRKCVTPPLHKDNGEQKEISLSTNASIAEGW